jgi:hypothetical protein
MEDDHLMRMLELTGETFSSSMLERSERHDEFFDNNGRKMVFMLQILRLNNCHPTRQTKADRRNAPA